MTTTNKLERKAWKPYFDNVSRLLAGKRIELDVASLNLGSQPVAKWAPVFGVTYDPNDDVVAILAEGLDHMIRRPRDVFVETEGVNLLSMEVIGGDGASQIVRFAEPLLLTAPQSSAGAT